MTPVRDPLDFTDLLQTPDPASPTLPNSGGAWPPRPRRGRARGIGCPFCGGGTSRVIRTYDVRNARRRRRRCLACDRHFDSDERRISRRAPRAVG